MKYNGHLTFQCVIDYWGACSVEGMPGAMFSYSVVATRKCGSHNCITNSKLYGLN